MSSVFEEEPCYALVSQPPSDVPTESELKRDLEKSDECAKYQAMKRLISSMLNGEKFPNLLMTVMRFVMPVKDNNKLKKLLLIYWEMVPKHSDDGVLLHEMILVCDAYRKDLTHPNEYVRGATLRFLCRLKEPDLLEPLMPAIRSCLQHRHPYVRRNAILAIFTIYKNFPQLIIDACELITSLLDTESDMSCRRNAFIMLIHVDQNAALHFLSKNEHDVFAYGDVLQLIVIELIYRSSKLKQFAEYKQMFLRIISQMIMGNSAPSVKYEAANILLTLSSSPAAIKNAAKCLVEIAINESDNNVKLIIIQKLDKLKEVYGDRNILQDLAVDILPIMNSADLSVIERTFELVNGLTNGRNLDNIIQICRHELTKGQAAQDKETVEKRTLSLVRALHEIVVKFPSRASDVVEALIEYLPQAKQSSALEILSTIKDVFVTQPQCVKQVLPKLIDLFPYLENALVIGGSSWVISEFSSVDDELADSAFNAILNAFSEFADDGDEEEATDEPEQSNAAASSFQPKVTTDGTYASQSALLSVSKQQQSTSTKLRDMILNDGEFSLAISLCSALTKISIRTRTSRPTHSLSAVKAMLALLNKAVGTTQDGKKMSRDEYERVVLCIRLLTCSSAAVPELYSGKNTEELAESISRNRRILAGNSEDAKTVDVDEPLKFGMLVSGNENADSENMLDETYRLAMGSKPVDEIDEIRLDCVHQLTGKVSSQFDIGLDILLINQTSETIQNLFVELFTGGDMKVSQRAPPINLAAHGTARVQSHIKVQVAEAAVVYGNLVYQLSSGTPVLVVLNEMKIDAIDFAKVPTKAITDAQFRKMWSKLEWENKINVQAPVALSMDSYLKNVMSTTKMRLLTVERVEESEGGGGGFLAANLYGQSAFGEDVIANVSLAASSVPNADQPATINGHVRIRAKSQGMALSIGDRITQSQASFKQ